MMNKEDFLQRVDKFIFKQQLLTTTARVVVAVSGGADSVALLCALHALGYDCVAVHCNFQLRGEESNRDENFVRQLCQKMEVKLHTLRLNTVEYAKNNGISIEMAARDLRYDYFEKMMKEEGAEAVAVAHHRDDNVETLLYHLVRGTGLHGLTGIPCRNGHVVRPFLELSRTDILDYLQQMNQSFVTDSTNLQDEAMRNKIRLNILPLLRQMNPQVDQSISHTIQHLQQAEALYRVQVEAARKRVMPNPNTISIPALQKEVSPQTILFEILSEFGFNGRQVDDVYCQMEGVSGRCYESAAWQLLRNRQVLELRRKAVVPTAVCDCILPETGRVRLNAHQQILLEREAFTEGYVVSHQRNVFTFDADKLEYPLSVRTWRKGDWFIPFGMKGKKLVSDYLTNLKYSGFMKQEVKVLCAGNQVVGILGERPDNRYRLDSTTRWVLKVTLLIV